MSVSLPEFRIGEPLRHKSLSVFPLFGENGEAADYVLSSEALEAESLVVTEVSNSGSVPELLVENKGDTRVLFLEGEQLIGAKQNRVLNTSILIAAGRKARIPVSCVEQGRWAYRSQHFGHSGSHSPSKLRRALKASVTHSLMASGSHVSDQGEVWQEVQRQQASLGADSDSFAMSDTFLSCEADTADYRAALPYVGGAVGLAVAVGGKVVAMDLFDKPATCEKVWQRALSGFVLDAIEAKDDAATAEPPRVEELLTAASAAEWKQVEPVGDGEEYRAQIHTDHGSVLSLDGRLVHGSVVTA